MEGLGFLDFGVRLSRIDGTNHHPLVKLDKVVNWEIFVSMSEEVRKMAFNIKGNFIKITLIKAENQPFLSR